METNDRRQTRENACQAAIMSRHGYWTGRTCRHLATFTTSQGDRICGLHKRYGCAIIPRRSEEGER